VGTLRGSLGCDSPPKSVSKGARFLGFLSSWVGSALGGISSIPPFWTSFGGIKLSWTPHEVFLISPKSCSSPWSDSEDRGLVFGELTRGLCSSRQSRQKPV
jgi:hypothetical protein